MAQQKVDGSQVNSTNLDLSVADGSVLTGVDADSLQGKTVGTSANQIISLDGSGLLPAVDGSQLTNLPSGGPLVFSKAANTAISNTTTLTDDPDLITGTLSAGIYSIETLVQFTKSGSAGAGIKVALGWTGTPDVLFTHNKLMSQTLAGSFAIEDETNSSNPSIFGSWSVATTIVTCKIIASIRLTTTGTISVQFAQNTAFADNLQSKAGSWMKVTKMD